jgi:hypothetical protein
MNYLQYPGSLTVTCDIRYSDGSGGHTLHPAPLTTTISVPKPDGIRVLSLDGMAQPCGQAIKVRMQVRCKGDDCIYFSCFAQEMNYGLKNLVTGISPKTNKFWSPDVPGGKGSGLFYYEGEGVIIDYVFYPDTPWIRSLNPNTQYLSVTQDIQISIVDPCGNLMPPIKIGSWTRTETKVGTDGYGRPTYSLGHNPSEAQLNPQ